MNGVAWDLLAVLLRTTLFLSAAAVAVRLVLKLACPASPAVHRAAWLLVLLTGWLWWRVPVTIPYPDAAAVKQVRWAMGAVAKQVAPERSGGVDQEASREQLAPASSPHLQQGPAGEGPVAAVRANWPVAAVGVWLSGMLFVVTVWIASYLVSLGQLRAAYPAERAWLHEWEDLCARHGAGKAIPFRVTENAGPLLCRAPRGYLLVVPAALWRRLAPAERLSILEHELAHWKRRDLMKSMIVRLLALPHWFNPLPWLAAGWFDEAAEWACDEAAKGKTIEGCGEYAKALLELNSILGPRRSYHAAASGRGVSVRIQRLLRPENEKDSLMKKTMILGTALGLALLCLVRLDLVAKEPSAKGQAATVLQKPLAVNIAAELGDKLTESQRLYCKWDAEAFGLPDPARWQDLSPQERAAKEEQLLKQLSSDSESERVKAIDGLVALRSKKAVPRILRIAADRNEKNNWDRHTATRALAMLGDPSAVPELVHLAYHYNWNVRQWARIALVRLTGQDFGRDVVAWSRWWQQQGGKPPINVQTVQWATSPEMLKYADPKSMDEADRKFAGGAGLARQMGQAGARTYWAKYRLWAGYHKGTGGVKKNPEEAKRLLAELVKGASLVTFRPSPGFAPRTPGEFLARFSGDRSLMSEPNGLGGGSFFRTKAKDGVLIGSFLTAHPEQTRKGIEATGSVKVISVEELTPEKFIRYEALPQESLE